jgi:hypothetical protein
MPCNALNFLVERGDAQGADFRRISAGGLPIERTGIFTEREPQKMVLDDRFGVGQIGIIRRSYPDMQSVRLGLQISGPARKFEFATIVRLDDIDLVGEMLAELDQIFLAVFRCKTGFRFSHLELLSIDLGARRVG